MRILLTGGSGDLGRILTADLQAKGDTPINLDVIPPPEVIGKFVEGSILDRPLLASLLPEVDLVVHIAAWHGIHEFRRDKDAFDFWDLNVTGTFNLLECCVQAGCSKFVFISSTSVDDWPGIYAHSKIVGEDLMRTYVSRHGMRIISLRPRAFIPPWNRSVYASIAEWAQWYWKGAVHINDVAQSVVKSIDVLRSESGQENITLAVDGFCEFSDEEMASWDAHGPGSTFKARFGEDNYRLALECGLDPSCKPRILGFLDAQKTIGYKPSYGFGQMLRDLASKRSL